MSNLAGANGRPFTLVLGLDLSDQESSGYAFDQAMRIAARIDGSDMHVLYVIADTASAEKAQEAVELLRLYVSEKVAALAMDGPQRAGIHLRRGDSAHELARLAADVGADMIVVGTHKSHLSSLWEGSTAERTMAATTCPVFVAGPRPKAHPSQSIFIDPPCPDCVQRRFASQGRAWWCDRHSENHHLRRHHIYSYQSDFSFSTPDSAVNATGTE
jgi:nucleotide-binding universal stress UspA family protein